MNTEENTKSGIPIGKDQQCPCFVVVLRILLKYLQNSGDLKAYEALRHRVRVCTEKARRQEPGYECVAKAVLEEIPHIIKASDLRRVQAIVRARTLKKRQQQLRKESENVSTEDSATNCEQLGIFDQATETAAV